MKRDTLVSIGEALIDFMPDRAGCAFSEVGAFSPKIGGAPANVCGAYAKLGGKARMLTQLGDDPFGHKILDELRDAGIDTHCIRLTDEANTALAFVSSGADGERTFSFYRKPSADMLYRAEYVTEETMADAYALHFCSVSLGDFPMKQAHTAAIERARAQGSIISFDPNLRFPLWNDVNALHDTVLEFLPLADVVKVSDEELEFLTGTDDMRKALPRLLVGNVKLVLFTLGKNGASALTAAHEAHVDGLPGKAVDPSDFCRVATRHHFGRFISICVRISIENNLPPSVFCHRDSPLSPAPAHAGLIHDVILTLAACHIDSHHRSISH